MGFIKLHLKCAVLYVIMIATQANLLGVQRPRLNSQMVLNVNVSLYQRHTMVIKTVSDIFNLLALELEPGVFSLLLGLRLANQLL